MTQGTRKLIGVFALIGLLVVYCVAVGAAYASFFGGQPWWVLILFFAVAGLGWFFPASRLIRWMAKPDS